MLLQFLKYQGAGNDFLIIDDRSGSFPSHDSALIQRLCHRQLGIGADGILLHQISFQADALLSILNADGSHPSMCGNGLRCFIHYLDSLEKKIWKVETKAGIFEGSVDEAGVALSMHIYPQIQELEIEGETLYLVNTGVPHLVHMTRKEDLESIDVKQKGRPWRFHSHLGEEGANVNFVALGESGHLHVRTYERGIEDETLACGTGCVAASLVAAHLNLVVSPVKTFPKSKSVIETSFQRKDDQFSSIQLKGQAVRVFKGEINI